MLVPGFGGCLLLLSKELPKTESLSSAFGQMFGKSQLKIVLQLGLNSFCADQPSLYA